MQDSHDMNTRQGIITKYRRIAHLPDVLFFFTFPIRRSAVQQLALRPGNRVLDVGCGTGPNFSFLAEAVGPAGEVVGFDLSPDMIQVARRRIERVGWKNVTALEAAAEEVDLPGEFNGAILFAMHDVLTSDAALGNVLRYLAAGARVVAVGPKLSTHRLGRLARPFILLLYRRLAVSSDDMDRPWRKLESRIGRMHIRDLALGNLYLGWGAKGAATSAA
jgi:demethylmenaquinone methyltransferase/2-methoxy-6-polyprenyl-1,4-benzoquinol methylase